MNINHLIHSIMEDKTKEQYLSPQIEVIPMETEGSVMMASPGGGLNSFDQGDSWGGSSLQNSRTRGYNSASSSDLEDLINDILTVEQ